MKLRTRTFSSEEKEEIRLQMIEAGLPLKKENPTFSSCPHCHEPVMPHRVCKNCGYYDGKEAVAKKETENA